MQPLFERDLGMLNACKQATRWLDLACVPCIKTESIAALCGARSTAALIDTGVREWVQVAPVKRGWATHCSHVNDAHCLCVC